MTRMSRSMALPMGSSTSEVVSDGSNHSMRSSPQTTSEAIRLLLAFAPVDRTPAAPGLAVHVFDMRSHLYGVLTWHVHIDAPLLSAQHLGHVEG
jgi:hypothetical protein